MEIVLICCFIPAALLFIVGFLAVRNFSRFLRTLPQFTAPDTEELERQYEALKAENPQANQQQLVRKIINQYAMRQGMVGAVTSVGGIVALPLGLSIDLIYSARSNAALSYFIAQVYGIESTEKTLNISQLLVLVKQRKISADEMVMWQEQYAGAAYQALVQSILQKSFAKVIPGLGAVIGYVVNYSSAQLFGTLANQYYSGNLGKLADEGANLLQDVAALSAEDRQKIWQQFREKGANLVGSSVVNMAAVVQKLQEKNYNPTADRITQLQQLVELKEKGALTEAEFESMKQALMGGLAEKMDDVEADILSDSDQPAADTSSDAGESSPLT